MVVSIWSGVEYYMKLLWLLREDAHTQAQASQQSNRTAQGR